MHDLILGFICGATLCGLICLLFLVDKKYKKENIDILNDIIDTRISVYERENVFHKLCGRIFNYDREIKLLNNLKEELNRRINND